MSSSHNKQSFFIRVVIKFCVFTITESWWVSSAIAPVNDGAQLSKVAVIPQTEQESGGHNTWTSIHNQSVVTNVENIENKCALVLN